MAAAGVFKSAGIIDYGYTGELKIILTATDTAYTIKKGERIAQIMPREIFTDSPVLEVRDLGDTSRGDGGFGSTGR